jgi:hypothetical protein
MKEEFKTIPGFEPYEVSNMGKLRKKGLILTTPISNIGYARKYLKDLKKNILMHRAIAICFIPNPENLREVNHIDGNKANNSIDNLEWVSRKGNAQHAKKHGLLWTPVGEDAGMAKLETVHVKIIKECIEKGFSQRAIGGYFNVTQSCISLINRNINWKSCQL